jgi:outer membrane immunogenic protein
MRNSLSGWLIVSGLAMLLGVTAPISTSAQDKKDSSTATNGTEGSEPPASHSEARPMASTTGSARPNSPAPAPTTSYNWTGGYVGGHAGWGRGRANTSFTPLPNATLFIDMTPTTLRPKPSGFNGGAQGGYSWQTGRFVIGGEADISWSRMSGTATVTPIIKNNGTPFPGAGFLTAHQDTKWFGTVRGRIGFTPTPRVLLYGTVGLVFGHVNYSANSDFRPGVPTPILFFQYPASLSKTKAGWTVGGGVEVGINKHWSWKAEYLYYGLGKESLTANPVPVNPPFQVAYTWETKAHTVNTGINFRF